MDKEVALLEQGTTCCAWNHSGQRLASASAHGTLTVFDSPDPSSSSFSSSSRVSLISAKTPVVKLLWLPPQYGDALACLFADGSFSIWEELAGDLQPVQWKECKCFKTDSTNALDLQFGVSLSGLSLVAAYDDGYVKVYELLDPLRLNNWQLQAEFQNVTDSVSIVGKASCSSASISWNLLNCDSRESTFVLGFNSDNPQLNSPKVWEFDKAHQRWLPIAELALPDEKGDQVYAVAWAPNIGRDFEVIAVATMKGIAVWHLGQNPDQNGRALVEKVALLCGNKGQVWQMEWDMSGMTLATTGSDGVVRLWQSNLNGDWQEQAAFEPTS